MNTELLNIFDSVKETIPPQLIEEKGISFISSIAGELPRELTTFYGLECKLGQKKALADISMEIAKASKGHSLLSGKSPSGIDKLCSHMPTWSRLREFAKLWEKSNHLFYSGIKNIWLEFDTSKIDSGVAPEKILSSPSIFFGMLDNKTPMNIFHILDKIAPNRAANKTLTDAYNDFIRKLPDKGVIFQMGIMLSRSTDALRVCIKDTEPEHIASWLSKIKWPGDVSRLERALNDLIPKLEKICVDLDLAANGLGRKIGLECYVNKATDNKNRWEALFSLIEEKKLMLKEKKQALDAFPGTNQIPLNLRTGSDGIIYINTVKAIHHIKLDFEGQDFTQAKAYLSLNRPGACLDQMFRAFDRNRCPQKNNSSDEPWLIR